ncbi:MAG TPA: hypothetical protein VFT71_06550 [Candidatus Nitrosocosmicus sp.]|nr:hypothetical protein [Candidatus Nitrosocosmicus sp.]
MRRIVYFPKPLENDSTQGEGRRQNNRGSNSATEIIEPAEYLNYGQKQKEEGNKQSRNDLLKRFFPDILKAIGNKAIKESPPTLQELEAYLQQHFSNLDKTRSSYNRDRNWRDMTDTTNLDKENQKGNRSSSSSSSSAIENTQTVSTPSVSSSNPFSNQKGRGFFGIDFRNTDMAENRLPIVTELIRKGYLTENSDRWLKKRGS